MSNGIVPDGNNESITFFEVRAPIWVANAAALGISESAAASLQTNETGMIHFGLFITEQFADEVDDFDFFTFPEIDPAVGADAVDAPIDGFCMSANPANEAGAKEFLAFRASPENAAAQNDAGYTQIWTNANADLEPLSELQKKSAEFLGQQASIAQFLDRDTRPDFASTVMIPSLQSFLQDPTNIDGLTADIEAQKQSIFATDL